MEALSLIRFGNLGQSRHTKTRSQPHFPGAFFRPGRDRVISILRQIEHLTHLHIKRQRIPRVFLELGGSEFFHMCKNWSPHSELHRVHSLTEREHHSQCFEGKLACRAVALAKAGRRETACIPPRRDSLILNQVGLLFPANHSPIKWRPRPALLR